MEKEETRSLTVAEAGARGGAATFAKYGREHFRAIGKKGQAKLAAKITTSERRIWGSMGGRPQKRHSFNTEEKGNIYKGVVEPAR